MHSPVTNMLVDHAEDLVTYPELTEQPGSIGNVEKMIIGHFLLVSQPKVVVETGSFRGNTSRYLAEFLACNGIREVSINCFDLPEVVENIRRSDSFFGSHPEITFVEGALPDSLANFLAACPDPVDFAIVDADHSYPAVKSELELLHPRLRAGAYVFCHDYRENDPEYSGTVRAVDEFVRTHGYDCLPFNESALRGRELIWGFAVLRKPLSASSPRPVCGMHTGWISMIRKLFSSMKH